jgi:hypothetical protein
MREVDRGDADMILKLYDLRRETEMRKARSFLGEYDVTTIDDVKAISDWNHPENAHFRQVMTYWGMVADFVVRGLLHPEMFAAHCCEALFIWSKFEPILPQIRAEINPMFLANIEAAIKSHPAIEAKAAQIREMRARMAAMAPAVKNSPKAKPTAKKSPAKSKKGR